MTLVGAGPGDPGLITLRGRDAIGEADVVLYDYLASPELLRWAPPHAECLCLGRHGSGRVLSQDEINRLMIQHAQAGKHVVRLKGGDPGLFGRLAEEVAAIEAAGIAYEIVPGITAATATSAYAGVALTHRDHASCVAIVTGREHPNKPATSLDYAALATFPGTLVFYMGITSAPLWSGKLLEHGKSADTPVRIVRRVTQPEQQVWTCRLEEVAQLIANNNIRPPAICIVGHVLDNQRQADWFVNRPLFGRTVLVTRPLRQADAMGRAFAELGARLLYQPAIIIGPPPDWRPVDEAIEHVGGYGWIVFSSRNGVESFLGRLRMRGHDLRALAGCKLAVIGAGTAEALAEHHLQADLQPEEYRAEALADSLAPRVEGERCLLVRASRGREVLAESLTAAGAEVEQIVAYESRDVESPDADVALAMEQGEIDWTTVTSSAIARSLIKLFGNSLRQTRLAAISPLTAETLAAEGFTADAVATDYTCQGLVAALCDAEQNR